MRRLTLAITCLIALVQSAVAADTSGPAALALAAVIASHDTALSIQWRDVMAKLFNGQSNVSFPAGQTISIRAEKVVCRASNVAINQWTCALTFGGHAANISARLAHELYATVAEAGVPSDGAAGSMFEALTALDCTIDPNVLQQNGGGGASCTFTPGP